MWDGVGFTLSLSGGEETPEAVRLALMEKVRVLGEKPFSPNLKSLESDVWEPSLQRAHGAQGYILSGGAPRGTAPSAPENHGHRSVTGKPPSLM
jgi:hypothetical protein